MEKRTETSPTIEELVQKTTKQEQKIAELSARLKWYEEQFRLAQHKRFGASREQTPHPDQLTLDIFNEAEAAANPALPESTTEQVVIRQKKKVGSREAKLSDLPVEVIEYRLSDEEQICPCCAGKLHGMSTEVRRELKVKPAEVFVVEHVRHVYACRRCEQTEVHTPVKTAPMPKPALAGSLASPSMLAYLMSQKYADSLPLYRQEQQFKRLGVSLSRQTMANWLIAGGERWLAPLYDYMHAELLKRDIVQADETTFQVLREPGRAADMNSYMWLYRTGRVGPDIILYDYQPGRGSEYPSQFLAGFTGYLQTDGYSGYNRVEGVTQLGCWAHARRKYHEALQGLPAA